MQKHSTNNTKYNIIIINIIIIITAVDSSPNNSTDKTNKNKYT